MQQVYEQELSRQELQKLRNNRTGLLLFQLSWILVFICLTIVNLQMRGNFLSWPPPGVSELPVLLPVVATVALVLSSVLVQRALSAIRADDITGVRRYLLATLGLALLFVTIMAYEWAIVPADAGQYGAIFRVMTGFHAVHALAIGAFLWRIRRRAAAGTFNARNHWSLEAGVKLWHFVTVAWGLFFIVLYVI